MYDHLWVKYCIYLEKAASEGALGCVCQLESVRSVWVSPQHHMRYDQVQDQAAAGVIWTLCEIADSLQQLR